MKQLHIPFIALVLSLASCKKNRTCTCTGTVKTVTNVTNSSGTYSYSSEGPVTITRVYPRSKRSAAKANCLSSNYAESATSASGGATTKNDYVYNVTCSLK